MESMISQNCENDQDYEILNKTIELLLFKHKDSAKKMFDMLNITYGKQKSPGHKNDSGHESSLKNQAEIKDDKKIKTRIVNSPENYSLSRRKPKINSRGKSYTCKCQFNIARY
jgi:hypothetical protein